MEFFNKSAPLFILAGLLGIGADAQAIVPRGEGNTKHPLLKKLGESAVFKSHIRQLKLQQAHDGLPRSVFENPKKPDESAISVPIATGAGPLHKLGQRGKGMTIAIIEDYFSRKTIADLANKKLLHPGAQHLHLPPQGALEKLDIKALARKSYDLKSQIILEIDSKKREALVQERGRVKKLLNYKSAARFMEREEKERDGHHHGDMVLEAAHKMAPDATILPIQMNAIPEKLQSFFGVYGEHPFDDDDKGEDENGPAAIKFYGKLLGALRTAIDYKADVINLSLTLPTTHVANIKPIILALQRARDRGIAIVLGAGNDSTSENPLSFDLNPVGNSDNPPYVKSLAAHMLETLNYQGALVAGSTGYQPDGTSFVSDFSQIPGDQKSEDVFLLAPGQQIRLCGDEPQGTSLSAPLTAGAYALLKSYALTHKLPFKNPHDLLQVLRQSGGHPEGCYWTEFVHKAVAWPTLNVIAACQLLEERMIPKK